MSTETAPLLHYLKQDGGRGGIRTLERIAPLLVFKTSAFNHSATLPRAYDKLVATRAATFELPLSNCITCTICRSPPSERKIPRTGACTVRSVNPIRH